MSATRLPERIAALRAAYRSAAGALPWLDAARWPDDPPAFDECAADPGLPAVPRLPLERNPSDAALSEVAERHTLLVYDPERSGALEDLGGTLRRMANRGIPLVLLHTDVAFERIDGLAAALPDLQIIIESGPLKILYFIGAIERLMRQRANVWLCTWNLCNWLGLERMHAEGLADRLLFGTHAPRFNAHVSMGPIVMSRLAWRDRCNIAGDNLRRLLGLDPITPGEGGAFDPGEPLVVDSHGHSGPSGRFPAEDEGFAPADWLCFMDECAIEQLFLCPMQAIDESGTDPREQVSDLLAAAPGRFRYFEVFKPGADANDVARIERALTDPACAGIKIHPTIDGVAADDDSYAPAFALAERHGAALLTHSWEASATNPTQHLSRPGRFRGAYRREGAAGGLRSGRALDARRDVAARPRVPLRAGADL